MKYAAAAVAAALLLSGCARYDEPTARIPVGSTRQPESQSEDFDHFDSVPASNPTQEFEAPRGRVLSTESDLMEGDNPTQRIPTYEELSAPRREPQAVAEATDERVADRVPVRRGTLDLGLLLIRVVLGLILVAHGLQKLTGRWGGPDLSQFKVDLQTLGFDYAQQLAYVGSIGELIVGAVLVLGLFTPIAGAAAVALLINAWAAAQAADPGLQFFVDQSGTDYVFDTRGLINEMVKVNKTYSGTSGYELEWLYEIVCAKIELMTENYGVAGREEAEVPAEFNDLEDVEAAGEAAEVLAPAEN